MLFLLLEKIMNRDINHGPDCPDTVDNDNLGQSWSVWTLTRPPFHTIAEWPTRIIDRFVKLLTWVVKIPRTVKTDPLLTRSMPPLEPAVDLYISSDGVPSVFSRFSFLVIELFLWTRYVSVKDLIFLLLLSRTFGIRTPPISCPPSLNNLCQCATTLTHWWNVTARLNKTGLWLIVCPVSYLKTPHRGLMR